MAMKDVFLGQDVPDEEEQEDPPSKGPKYSSIGELMNAVGPERISGKDYGITLRVPTQEPKLREDQDPVGAIALWRTIKAFGDVLGIGEVEKEEYDIQGGGIPVDVTERSAQLGQNTDRTLEELGNVLGKDSAALKRLQYWNRLMGNLGTDTTISPLLDALQGDSPVWTRSGEYSSGRLAEPTNMEDMLADNLISPILGGLAPGLGAYFAVKAPVKAMLSSRAGLQAMTKLMRGAGVTDDVVLLASRGKTVDRTAEFIADIGSGMGFAGFYGARESLETEGKLDFGTIAKYAALGGTIGAAISGPIQGFSIKHGFRNAQRALDEGMLTRQAHIKYVQDWLPADTQIGDRYWDGSTWRWAEGAETGWQRKRKGSYAPAPWKIDVEGTGDLADALVKAQVGRLDAALKEFKITKKPLMNIMREGKLEEVLQELQQKMQAKPGGGSVADLLAQKSAAAQNAARVTITKDVQRIAGSDPERALAATDHATRYLDTARDEYHRKPIEVFAKDIQARDEISQDAALSIDARLSAAAESSAMKQVAEENGYDSARLVELGVQFPKPTVFTEDGGTISIALRLSQALDDEAMEEGFPGEGIPGLSHFRRQLWSDKATDAQKEKAQRVINMTNKFRDEGRRDQLTLDVSEMRSELTRKSVKSSRGLGIGMKVLIKDEQGEWVEGTVMAGTRHGKVTVHAKGENRFVDAIDLVIQPETGDWVTVRMADGSVLPGKIDGFTGSGEGKTFHAVLAEANGVMREQDIRAGQILTVGRESEKEAVASQLAVREIQRRFGRNVGTEISDELRWVPVPDDGFGKFEMDGYLWKITQKSEDGEFIKIFNDKLDVAVVMSRNEIHRRWTKGSFKSPRSLKGADGKGTIPKVQSSPDDPTPALTQVEVDPKTNALNEKVGEAGEVPWEQAELSLEQTPAPDWPDSPVTGELEHVSPAAAPAAGGVRRIISGGQTGADEGGILAGLDVGLETGGTAPYGWTREGGKNRGLLEGWGLVEGPDAKHYARNYAVRTVKNIEDADATVVFGNPESKGSKLTVREARSRGKPVIIVKTSDFDNPEAAEKLAAWLKRHNVETLNVAGNRESRNAGIREKSRKILSEALRLQKAAPAVAAPAPTKRIPMNFIYGQGTAGVARPEIMAHWAKFDPKGRVSELFGNFPNTLGAIKAGFRTSTTRARGQLDDVEVGQTVTFFDRGGRSIDARVTSKGIVGDEGMPNPEAWSKAEGYAVEFANEQWGRLKGRDYIRYEPVQSTPAPTRPSTKFGKGQLPSKSGSHIAYISLPTAVAQKVLKAFKDGGPSEALWDSLVQGATPGGKTGWHGLLYAPQIEKGHMTLAIELGEAASGKRKINETRFARSLGFLFRDGNATVGDLANAKAIYKENTLEDIAGVWHVDDNLLAGDMSVPMIKDVFARGDKAEIQAMKEVLKRQINASNNLPPGYRDVMDKVRATVVQDQDLRATGSRITTEGIPDRERVVDRLTELLELGDRPIHSPDAIDKEALSTSYGMMQMLHKWKNWNILERFNTLDTENPMQVALNEVQILQQSIDGDLPRPTPDQFTNSSTGELNKGAYNTALTNWERDVRKEYLRAEAYAPMIRALEGLGVAEVGEDAVTINIPHATNPSESMSVQVTYPDRLDPVRVRAARLMGGRSGKSLMGSGAETATGPQTQAPTIDEALETVSRQGGFKKGGQSVAILGGNPADLAADEGTLKSLIWKAIKLSGIDVGEVRTRTVGGKRMSGKFSSVDEAAYNMQLSPELKGEGIRFEHSDAGPKKAIFVESREIAREGTIPVTPGETRGQLTNAIKPDRRPAILDGSKRATVRTDKIKLFKGDGWYDIDGQPVYVRYHGEMGYSDKLKQAAYGDEVITHGAQKDWADGNRDLHTYSFSHEAPVSDAKTATDRFTVARSLAKDGDDDALLELATMVTATAKMGSREVAKLKKIRNAAQTLEYWAQRGFDLDAEGRPVYGESFTNLEAGLTDEGLYVGPDIYDTMEIGGEGGYKDISGHRVEADPSKRKMLSIDEQTGGYDQAAMDDAIDEMSKAVALIRNNRELILRADQSPTGSDIPIDKFKAGTRLFRSTRASLQEMFPGSRDYDVIGARTKTKAARPSERGRGKRLDEILPRFGPEKGAFPASLTDAGRHAIETADAVIYIVHPTNIGRVGGKEVRRVSKDAKFGLARAVRIAEQKGKPVTVVYKTGDQWRVHSTSLKGPKEEGLPGWLRFMLKEGDEEILGNRSAREVTTDYFGLSGRPETIQHPEISVNIPGLGKANLGAPRKVPVAALRQLVPRSQYARMQRETAQALREGKLPPIWIYYQEMLAKQRGETFDVSRYMTPESHPFHVGYWTGDNGVTHNFGYTPSRNAKKQYVRRSLPDHVRAAAESEVSVDPIHQGRGTALSQAEKEVREADQRAVSRQIAQESEDRQAQSGLEETFGRPETLGDMMMAPEGVFDTDRLTEVAMESEWLEDLSKLVSKEKGIGLERARAEVMSTEVKRLEHLQATDRTAFMERVRDLDRLGAKIGDYSLPELGPNFQSQALDLAAMLHNFNVRRAHSPGVGEYIHNENANVYAWVQKIKGDSPYKVSMRHAPTPGSRSQIVDRVHQFGNRRNALEFLHQAGFRRNQNRALIQNYELLSELPDPSLIDHPADIINLNTELAAAIETAHKQYGHVPSTLADYANDFVDKGWRRFFDVDQPILLGHEDNLRHVGYTRSFETGSPVRPTTSRGVSRAFAMTKTGELIRAVPEDEMVRLRNPKMGSNRELYNMSPQSRLHEWSRLGLDQYDQERFLSFANMDLKADMGTGDPRFQDFDLTDWLTFQPVMFLEDGQVRVGMLRKPNVGPFKDTLTLNYYDPRPDADGIVTGWVTKEVPKSDSYMSVLPGDPWDPRKIAGMTDRTKGMNMYRHDTPGTGSFDKDWSLTGLTGRAEHKKGMLDALNSILKGREGKKSPFIVRDGDKMIFSMSRAKDDDINTMVDWYLRFAETQGRPFRNADMVVELARLKSEMGIKGQIQKEGDFLDTIQALALDRARKMIGDPDEIGVDLLARARVGLLDEDMISQIRMIAKDRYGLKGVDDMTPIEVAEEIVPLLDRNFMDEASNIQKNSLGQLLAAKASQLIDDDTGEFVVNVSHLRELGGKVTEIVPKIYNKPKEWFENVNLRYGWMFPRTLRDKNPTFKFFYDKANRYFYESQQRLHDLRRNIDDFWGVYDPDGETMSLVRGVLKAGYRDWDDFIERGSKADVDRLSRMIVKSPRKFEGKNYQLPFETFFRSVWDELDAARLDLIETQFTAGDAPIIRVNQNNYYDPEVVGLLKNYQRHGGVPEDVHMVVFGGKSADGTVIEPTDFFLPGPRNFRRFRSREEVDFFMNTMIRGQAGRNTIDDKIRDQYIARGWDYMENEWNYYKDWGANMEWPVVNEGRFSIYTRMPGDKGEGVFFGYASSEREAKNILNRLTRDGDPRIKKVLDAKRRGEDARITVQAPAWVKADTDDFSIMHPEMYRAFVSALGKETDARGEAEIVNELLDIGVRAQLAKHSAYETISGTRVRPDKGWTDNPYDELSLYMNRIAKIKYSNKLIRAARDAMDVDANLSKLYGTKPVFDSPALQHALSLDPTKAQKAVREAAREDPVYKYMEDYISYMIGERTWGEKRVDEVLQTYEWMHTKLRPVMERGGDTWRSIRGEGEDPVIDLNKAYRIIDSLGETPSSFKHRSPVYYRKYAGKNLAQQNLHGQAMMRLGFGPASAMVNYTQWMINTIPVLGERATMGGHADALYFMASTKGRAAKKEAERLFLKHGNKWPQLVREDKVKHSIPKEWMEIYDILDATGVELVAPRTQAEQGMGLMIGENPLKSPLFHPDNPGQELWSKAEYYGLYMFNGAERVNRATTAMAANRASKTAGPNGTALTGQAKLDFIRSAVEDTQFLYASEGLPPFMRSSHLRVLTQFKPFLFNQLKYETDMISKAARGTFKKNPDFSGWSPVMKHFAALGMFGGAAGLAYSPVIYGLSEAAGVMAGVFGYQAGESSNGTRFKPSMGDFTTSLLYRFDLLGAKDQGMNAERGVVDNPWFRATDVLRYGVPGLFDVDASRRLNITGPELMVSRMGDKGAAVLGPHWSMYLDLLKAMGAEGTGDAAGPLAQTGAAAGAIAGAPFARGFGGLIAGLALAQVATLPKSLGKNDRALISPSLTANHVKTLAGPFFGGYQGENRDLEPGDLFASKEGRRFAGNISPTILKNLLTSAEMASYGKTYDIGNNMDQLGPGGWGVGGPHASWVMRESLSRAIGFGSVRSSRNRMHLQISRDAQEKYERTRDRFATAAANEMIRGGDFVSILAEAMKQGIYIDERMLTSRVDRALVPMIRLEWENRLQELR